MVGNAIYITTASGNWTVGFYFITAYSDTNTVTLDRTPNSGNATAGSGKVGGALTTLYPITSTAGVQSNIGTIWVRSGSYTMNSASISLPNMTAATSYISYLNGYKTVRGDNPTSTDRPAIDLGTVAFSTAAYWEVTNLSMTGTSSALFNAGNTGSKTINCKFVNTGGATKAGALSSNNSNIFINCEFSSAGGYAIAQCLGSFIGCYLHDSVYGAQSVGAAATFINCIIDTCSTAGLLLSGASCNFNNLTIYNCGVGIDLGGQTVVKITNSIITGCTTGISASSVGGNNQSYFNIYNNSTNATNVVLSPSDVVADPLLNNPANGDFTLQSGSPALNKGIQNGTNTGAVGSYKWNIGVDQDSNSGGGPSIGAAY
jgi:hypothetical protein